MHAFRQPVLVILILSLFLAVISLFSPQFHEKASFISISRWSTSWIQDSEVSATNPPSAGTLWHPAAVQQPLTTVPVGAVGAWAHISIPPTTSYRSPALYIEQLYGLDIAVYEGDEAIFTSSRDYDFERNILLVPLAASPVDTDLYIRMQSKEDAGIASHIRIGEFDDLSSASLREELPNVLLGAAIAFLGFILLLSTGFFVRTLTRPANALSLFILSTGILIITNSSLPYLYYPQYGPILFFLFDAFLLVLFPSLFYFVLQSFENVYGWLKKSQSWIIGYSAASFLVMVAYKFANWPLYIYYKLFTFWILAPLVLAQLVVIMILAIHHTVRKKRGSLLLSAGIIGLALSGIADFIMLSYRQGPYEFVVWKFGIVFLIACLVMTMNRRIAADYARLLAYSEEMKLYYHQLQKSERMQIISELAASIAHEVRNPLQVSRGFLQLLSGRSNPAHKPQFDIAISELDRAADIITEYLTFAKPDQETQVLLDVKQELATIGTILHPMIMLHGGTMHVQTPQEPTIISGNPSKFKQVIINIVKNSIESFQENGIIAIEAIIENETAVIRITDNGSGMDEEQLGKLGNPYFSTKAIGTGLGLMVTFRIMEGMNGTLVYSSEKGKGTEATIRFPLVLNGQTLH